MLGALTSCRLGCDDPRAELLQHAQTIPRKPVLLDLAIHHADNSDPLHLHLLARRWNAKKLALVGPAPRGGRDDQIALGDHLIHGKLHIGEGAPVHGNERFLALGAVKGVDHARIVVRVVPVRRGVIMVRVVGVDQLIGDIQIPLTPGFLNPAPGDSFVLLERHGNLL